MKSFAVLVLGAWLTGTILLAVVATQNFATVDRMLSHPTPQAVTPLSALPHDTMRPLLRHLSSELNRLYFLAWGVVQIVLGLVLMIVLLALGRRVEAALAAVMLAIANMQFLWMTPRITEIGRALDFVPRNPLPPSAAPMMAQFWHLHAAFTGSDLLLMALGLITAWRLCFSGPPEVAPKPAPDDRPI
jgi:hypothetical protein